ncbi:hypothetical protein K0B41_23665, partial [Salmonella enterica subsp. enterica serovar Mbandaka]|nr:hypothetical protein [Salmonella enterica subsp. enterica serovar Mbandaka]
CVMSEAKWSITEAKCLQISHNKYASQRDAISHSMGNLMLSHSAGMGSVDKCWGHRNKNIKNSLGAMWNASHLA